MGDSNHRRARLRLLLMEMELQRVLLVAQIRERQSAPGRHWLSTPIRHAVRHLNRNTAIWGSLVGLWVRLRRARRMRAARRTLDERE